MAKKDWIGLQQTITEKFSLKTMQIIHHPVASFASTRSLSSLNKFYQKKTQLLMSSEKLWICSYEPNISVFRTLSNISDGAFFKIPKLFPQKALY